MHFMSKNAFAAGALTRIPLGALLELHKPPSLDFRPFGAQSAAPSSNFWLRLYCSQIYLERNQNNTYCSMYSAYKVTNNNVQKQRVADI